MEPEINGAEGRLAPLKKVTPLSKYLAMTLFIILPFIGGWIGYTYAPEKVVEIEKLEEAEKAVVEEEEYHEEVSYSKNIPLSEEMLLAMKKAIENDDENIETHIVVLNESDTVVGNLIVHKYNTSAVSEYSWYPDQVTISAGLDYVTSPLKSGLYKLAYIEFTSEKTNSSARDFPVVSFEKCSVSDDNIFCDWVFEGEFYRTSILDVIKDKEYVEYINPNPEIVVHYENRNIAFASYNESGWGGCSLFKSALRWRG